MNSVMDDGGNMIPRWLLSNFFCEERPITIDEACGLRLLLFGSTTRTFGAAWTRQDFIFRKCPSYGIIQRYAGPCGLLAAVQAFVLYELLFGYSRTVLDFGFLNPKSAELKEALSRALSTILWQAGDQRQAIFAFKYDTPILQDSNIMTSDGILEYIKLKYFRNYESLLNHIYNYIQDIKKKGGCILFLYSLLLTHGIDQIKSEMDMPDCHLIGDDQYCSQEIVNLLLTGKAVSNLFNGQIELDSGGEEHSILKGISKQSKIGLLSMSEYENTSNVGSYYKDPVYPVWIIYGKSHFTVLFGITRSIFKTPKEKFKLFYYDCLAHQTIDVCFIVTPNAKEVETEQDENLSVVECCILTRWPKSEIELINVKDGNTLD